MSELESLSNKELKKKCIEFGMPNVPVTDSSRKILIRRLETAMSGKPLGTTAKNNRRETMHVTKASDVSSLKKTDDNKKSASNTRHSRRTIAVPERHIVTTTTISEPEYSDVSPDRVETDIVRAKTSIPENSSPLYPKLPTKEPSPKPLQLSKTGVVTTSYIQEITPINKTYADENVLEQEANEKNANNSSESIYFPISETSVKGSLPLTSTLSASKRYSSLNAADFTNLNYLTSTNVYKSYIPPTGGYKSLRASQYKGVYEEEIDNESDCEDEDEVVLVEESPIKDAETPFLSQFARNLEQLKATPLQQRIGPSKISPPKSLLRNRDGVHNIRALETSVANLTPRRSTKPTEDSSFRQILVDWEETYHLKHALVMISLFIFAVFIYVFFIQSV